MSKRITEQNEPSKRISTEKDCVQLLNEDAQKAKICEPATKEPKTNNKYEIYEPPAGSRMGIHLEEFKKLNGLPLDKYRDPLSWTLDFEGVAERDGVGLFCGYSVVLPYDLTRKELNLPGFAKIMNQPNRVLHKIVEKFEEYSDTPDYYFTYNYLKLVLQYREDMNICIE